MTGQVALVTGAGGGIGRRICAALTEAGWTVAGTDLPGVELTDCALAVPADLRDRDACRHLVAVVVSGLGGLDLLVNNAASMTAVDPTVATMPRWWRDIEVNLTAPLWLTQAALPALRQTGGQVLNVSSISGLQGEPGFSAYAASKAGLVGMTRSLARELAPAVRVNAVAPGPTDTDQLGRDADWSGLTMAELHEKYVAGMPIGRLVAPDEVAGLVVFLAGSRAITGECVQINGGMLMS